MNFRRQFPAHIPENGHRSIVPFIAILLMTAALPAAQTPGAPAVTISGNILGSSGHHKVYVALWNANGFLVRPVEQVQIEPGAATIFHFRITPGRYAVSAYEDENDNGRLDEGAFGPKEPSGFSRPFHGWRKPRFDDVATEIDRDTTDVNIRLSK